MKKLDLVNKMFQLSQKNTINVMVMNKQTEMYDPTVTVTKCKMFRENYTSYINELINDVILEHAKQDISITHDTAVAILRDRKTEWDNCKEYERVCKFQIYDDYVEALYRDMPDFNDRYIVEEVLVIETEQSSGNHFK